MKRTFIVSTSSKWRKWALRSTLMILGSWIKAKVKLKIKVVNSVWKNHIHLFLKQILHWGEMGEQSKELLTSIIRKLWAITMKKWDGLASKWMNFKQVENRFIMLKNLKIRFQDCQTDVITKFQFESSLYIMSIKWEMNEKYQNGNLNLSI